MANTYPTVVLESPDHDRGIGATMAPIVAACTNAAGTTAMIDKRGLSHGCVFNESGGAVTITYYAAHATTGTPRAFKMNGGSAVTQTIPDGECHQLPEEVAGVPFLVPVLSTGTATLRFYLER